MKERILEATILVFNEKGLKFTMDDLAKKLAVSKKTLYTVFPDKKTLIYEMVTYCFDSIKEAEQKVLLDDQLELTEKIERVMIVLPDRFHGINIQKLYGLQEKYPEVFEMVARRLESDWQPTIELLEQGISRGKIRPVNLAVLKTMVEVTIERFLQNPVLVENGLSYEEGLAEMMNILMRGIVTNENCME